MLTVFYGTANSLQSGSFSTGDCCLDKWCCYFITAQSISRRVCMCTRDQAHVYMLSYRSGSIDFSFFSITYSDQGHLAWTKYDNQKVVGSHLHQEVYSLSVRASQLGVRDGCRLDSSRKSQLYSCVLIKCRSQHEGKSQHNIYSKFSSYTVCTDSFSSTSSLLRALCMWILHVMCTRVPIHFHIAPPISYD